MKTIRRIIRVFLLLIWMPISGLCSLLFVFGGWGNIKRVCHCARIWGGGIAFIISMKKKFFGDMSQFKGGLIVSNHTGYLDIIAHASSFPIRFTPKQDIRKWPLMGWYVGIGRPIWVDRSSKQKSIKLKKDFVDTMRHGIPLIIYPEGTSTDGFSGILPFKSTPFAAVAETDLPILPVVTVFDPPNDGSSLAWYGAGDDATLIPHCWHILGHKKIEVELHILPVIHPEGRSRKELAAYVHGKMQEKYEQIMREKGYSIKGQ
ncbi:MAG: 1-acyl-sn-glycerol-3-phosphate acyltransferase [Victivallales bacterium]|nr:1-acyl-sn-glycerol-3-phosphate acyltransferase [Victivallales bacterium]